MATTPNDPGAAQPSAAITAGDVHVQEPNVAIPVDSPQAVAGSQAVGIGRTRDGQVFQMTHGMEVVGSDGERVGRIKEVHPADVLVDRAWKRDVYVPFEAVKEVRNNQLVLTVPAGQVDAMSWPRPSLI